MNMYSKLQVFNNIMPILELLRGMSKQTFKDMLSFFDSGYIGICFQNAYSISI